MVNPYNEIAEKMPWVKKKENPKKPWDSPAKEESRSPASGPEMAANKSDIIARVKDIQNKVSTLTDEKEALAAELESVRTEINEKHNVIEEKDNNIDALNARVESLENEKKGWDVKIADLEQTLKTATAEKIYLEEELAVADKTINEINNLLSS